MQVDADGQIVATFLFLHIAWRLALLGVYTEHFTVRVLHICTHFTTMLNRRNYRFSRPTKELDRDTESWPVH